MASASTRRASSAHFEFREVEQFTDLRIPDWAGGRTAGVEFEKHAENPFNLTMKAHYPLSGEGGEKKVTVVFKQIDDEIRVDQSTFHLECVDETNPDSANQRGRLLGINRIHSHELTLTLNTNHHSGPVVWMLTRKKISQD